MRTDGCYEVTSLAFQIVETRKDVGHEQSYLTALLPDRNVGQLSRPSKKALTTEGTWRWVNQGWGTSPVLSYLPSKILILPHHPAEFTLLYDYVATAIFAQVPCLGR